MKIRLKIRSKLMLSILLITSIAYAISIGYLVVKLRDISLRDSYEKADITARESANRVRTYLNHDMDLSRALTHSMSRFREIPQNLRSDFFIKMIKGVAIENPSILSVWGSWEISALDSTYKKPYGRHRFTYYRENGVLKYKEETLNTEGDVVGSGYHNVKLSKRESMIDPYWFSYTDDSPLLLEASTAVPLLENGEFMGLFGLDIELSVYQQITNSINPFEGSFSIMLSNNSTIVGHLDKDLLGKPFADYYAKINELNGINEKVLNGENFSFTTIDSVSGNEYYATFAAIQIGQTTNPWSFGIFVPTSVLLKEAASITQNSIILSIFGITVLAIVIWLIAFNITNPLVRAKNLLGELAEGKIDNDKKLSIYTGDEIEDISTSINTLIDGLSKTSTFAMEIGKGNLNVSYTTLSDDDLLGKSLLDMRTSLVSAKVQEDLRRVEDDKINWATSGMAKFAEILRQNNNNIEEFAYQIISNLVKYVNANIGALFLYSDDKQDDPHFELISSYAYERRKYENKRLEIGEGLVGRCALELETIYLTEIPKDYIQIASGLGFDSPTCLLIVPLKLNDVVYGVIELASLDIIEKHKIDFVEKIGESIAATISTVKINVKTVKLLDESRVKSEELASQEEEMRQNMEELQATQEEAARKTAEMESLINALNVSSYVIEYDIQGKVIAVNEAYLKLTNQSLDQIIGTFHADNLILDEKQLRDYNLFWEDLRQGRIKKETSKVELGGKTFTFIETYSPIFNENQKVVKVLKIAHNITDFLDQK
jgi:methyl-accepting chemotaxis protein